MSAPQGPREPTRDSRGRGRARGTFQSRDGRGDGRTRPSSRQMPATTALSSAPPQPFKPSPRQNGVRTRSPRGRTTPSSTARPGAGTPSRSAQNLTSGSRTETWRDPLVEPSSSYQKRMSDLFQTLKKRREAGRRDAIKNGFLADPDRPTSLANAITPVGTCQDMCSEFERVERIVQLMVDGCEKVSSESGVKVPWEEYMVKRFRRSAAGYDEQLPSDIRPPLVLRKTLDYLFDEVVGGPQPLAAVHQFVWDRTRGIRNDFSIQQVAKVADLRIAIDCFERIARFHILSLHQLSRPGVDSGDFDPHQEREQLNNTLLSLMYYYDDSRHKMTSPNEAEFRAYCIIFEIQEQRPDLEDRAQQWPRPLLQDGRVQTALRLYAAAGNTSDEQGPLRPRVPFSIAQANTGRFWSLVKSNAVSYLMACVAEIYFGIVRRTALENVWKAYKGKRGGPTKMEDWVLDDLKNALGFDDEEQTQAFCEDLGFTIAEKEGGEAYVDLGSVASRYLEDTNPRRKQIFSRTLVEQKRLGRTFPAVINGLSASQAQSQGLVNDSSAAETSSVSDREPLFVGDSDEEQKHERARSATPERKDQIKSDPAKLDPSASPFNPSASPFRFPTSSGAPFASSGNFGKPTPFGPALSPPTNLSSRMSGAPGTEKSNPFGAQQTPNFIFPTILDTRKQGNNEKSTSPTAQLKNLFKQPPSLSTVAPEFSSGTSPLFGKDRSKGSTSSSQELAQAASKESTSNPAESISSYPKTQEPSPATPGSTLSQPPTSTSPLFLSPKATSAPFPDYTSTSSLFPPSNTPTTSSEPLSTGTSTPFSKFLPSAGKPMFPVQQGSDKANNFLSSPSYPKASTPETSSANTTPSQPFLFPPPVGPIPQITISQPATSSSLMETSQPRAQAQSSTTSSPFSPNPSRSPFAPSLPPAEQAKTRPRRPDPRPAALDKLSQAMVMDDEGLLSQFVEYTVGPIIAASFRQVKDERSWTKAREVRAILLGRKYVKKWQANAWKKCLLRKGKERRKNFAQSMRRLAQSTRDRPIELTLSSHFTRMAPDNRHGEHEAQELNTMPPPSMPSKKRTSLPGAPSAKTQTSTLFSNKKRKHHSSPHAKEITPSTQKASHKRSSTVSGLSVSHPPRKHPRSLEFSRIGYSSLADGTIINESLMRKARQLAPRARTDTTNTDYFLLKSRGIDPDTPIVPQTRPRRSTTSAEDTSESHKLRKTSPPNSSSSPLTRPTNRQTPHQAPLTTGTAHPPSSLAASKTNPEDEALFASIANVRSALAESISWFQSERAKSESLSKANTPPPDETEKEKRLRKFQFTPSRTEQRMRASGAGHFWDSRRAASSANGSPAPVAWNQSQAMGAGLDFGPMWNADGATVGNHANSHELRTTISTPLNAQPTHNQTQPIGFAALGRGVGSSGVGMQKAEGKGKGASAEDAIEL